MFIRFNVFYTWLYRRGCFEFLASLFALSVSLHIYVYNIYMIENFDKDSLDRYSGRVEKIIEGHEIIIIGMDDGLLFGWLHEGDPGQHLSKAMGADVEIIYDSYFSNLYLLSDRYYEIYAFSVDGEVVFSIDDYISFKEGLLVEGYIVSFLFFSLSVAFLYRAFSIRSRYNLFISLK